MSTFSRNIGGEEEDGGGWGGLVPTKAEMRAEAAEKIRNDYIAALKQHLRDAEAQTEEFKRRLGDLENEYFGRGYTIDKLNADLTATKARCAELECDAARYQKLRSIHWFDGDEALIVTRTRHAKLGVETFSTTRLDAVLDALAKLDAGGGEG